MFYGSICFDCFTSVSKHRIAQRRKKETEISMKKQGSEPIYGPLPLSFTYAVTGL